MAERTEDLRVEREHRETVESELKTVQFECELLREAHAQAQSEADTVCGIRDRARPVSGFGTPCN